MGQNVTASLLHQDKPKSTVNVDSYSHQIQKYLNQKKKNKPFSVQCCKATDWQKNNLNTDTRKLRHTFILEKPMKNFGENALTILFVKKYAFSKQKGHPSHPRAPRSSTDFLFLENWAPNSSFQTPEHTSAPLQHLPAYDFLAIWKLRCQPFWVKMPIAESLRLRKKKKSHLWVH